MNPTTPPLGEPDARLEVDDAGLRARQRPLKDRYRADPASALVPTRARARVDQGRVTSTIEGWAGPVRAGLHPAGGGDGTDACSADLLLQALAGCAGVTLAAVATSMGVHLRSAVVEVTGTWDARGTLGVDRNAPVGLTSIDIALDLDTDANDETVARLINLTERYCVIVQTLSTPPPLTVHRV